MSFRICPECGTECDAYDCRECGRIERTPEQIARDVAVMQPNTALRSQVTRLTSALAAMQAERDGWQEEARRFAANADYWRTERDEARKKCAQQRRELERWAHGEQIESDYICPNALELLAVETERDEARAALKDLADDLCGLQPVLTPDECIKAISENDLKLRQENERLRPVYEAALEWHAAEARNDVTYAIQLRRDEALVRLRSAIDSALAQRSGK